MLKSISLQNFRSYSKDTFSFDNTTLIIGPNTSGKTNLIEAIYLLSTGKSFRTDKDLQMIRFGSDFAKIKGEVDDPSASSGQGTSLEVILTNGELNGGRSQLKKFLVNGVARRRIDFAANLPAVLFSPQDLDIIVDSPSLRRNFLDEVLETVDRDYRVALLAYTKAIRQRNALLERVREEGFVGGPEKVFEYWDKLVIDNGQIITKKRAEFIEYFNNLEKDIFDCIIKYDQSIISRERLLQYKQEEIMAGVTLVGPHRDDFSILMFPSTSLRTFIANSSAEGRNSLHDVKFYGSRGQQRLAILQLKIAQIKFVEERLKKPPIFILDDIFSELDEGHINLIFDQIGKQQTILTTTHREFIPKNMLKLMKIVSFTK
jgi:DNA replication and repair protein RecF